jgi:hypothetical protein
MLHHLIDIAGHLNQYDNDPLLRNYVLPMKTKFAKYWNYIPMLYSFAFVLDPRAKMRGFHMTLTLISNLTSTDYANYYESVRAQLTAIFTNYDLRFGGQNPHRKQAPHAGAGKKRKAWGGGGRYMVLMQLVEFFIHLLHLNLIHLIHPLPPVPSCLNLNQS